MDLYYEQIDLPAKEAFRLIRWHRHVGEAETVDASGRAAPFAGAGERWHFHPEVELTLVEAGEGIRVVGDGMAHFRGPDLILLGSHLPHCWKGLHHSTGMAIQFHPGAPTFGSLSQTPALCELLKAAERGLRLTGSTRRSIRERFRELAAAPALRRMALFWEMLATLAEAPSGEREPLSARSFAHVEHSPYQEPMELAVRWIFEHAHDEAAALPALLKAIGMSRSTFSRQFPRHTGKTFSGLLNQIRLEQARRHLADGRMPIAAVAYASGYGNLSYFNRVFRASTGETPSAYRRRTLSQSGDARPIPPPAPGGRRRGNRTKTAG